MKENKVKIKLFASQSVDECCFVGCNTRSYSLVSQFFFSNFIRDKISHHEPAIEEEATVTSDSPDSDFATFITALLIETLQPRCSPLFSRYCYRFRSPL